MQEKSLGGRKKNQICKCSRPDQMPLTGQITEIAPYGASISELPSNISTMVVREAANRRYFLNGRTTKRGAGDKGRTTKKKEPF